MIEIKKLSIAYQHNIILQQVRLTVPEGGSCAIIGPSGSGKSTLLKAVAGLLRPQEGEICLNGRPLDVKEQIVGYLPQSYGLLPWLTARENILLGLALKRPQEQVDRELVELMQLLGLQGLEERYPSQLSGGQQQRVALARIFLLKPDVVLLDEPFAALDALTREEILGLFLSLWQKYQITALLVTHFVDEALLLGQQIAVITGKPGTIQFLHQNPFWGQEQPAKNADYLRLRQELRRELQVTK